MNIENAQMWLKTAIERHQRHMMGHEPTDGEMGLISQRLMMVEMESALKAMNSMQDVKPDEWYANNVDKVKMKKM